VKCDDERCECEAIRFFKQDVGNRLNWNWSFWACCAQHVPAVPWWTEVSKQNWEEEMAVCQVQEA